VAGTWWRVNHPGGDPLRWTDEPADGRWERGATVRALYLADSAETAWAEWFRHTSELGVPPQKRMPRDLWRFHVDLDRVADLTAPGELAKRGVRNLSPSRRQWSRTQPIGERAWRQGFAALLAPSAARADGLVLVVFRTEPGSIAGVRPIKPAKRVSDLPALPTGLRT
jgi:RES domain-containing protein